MMSEEETKSLLSSEQQGGYGSAVAQQQQQQQQQDQQQGQQEDEEVLQSDSEEAYAQQCWVSKHKILTAFVILVAWICIGFTVFLVLFLKVNILEKETFFFLLISLMKAPALPIPPDDHELR